MEFRFTTDQQDIIEAAKAFFDGEHSIEYMRSLLEGKSVESLWQACAELGLFSIMVSDKHDGMGQDLATMAGIAEAAGYVGFCENFVETAGVIVPMLESMEEYEILSKVITGEVKIGILSPQLLGNTDADKCDYFIKTTNDNHELVKKHNVTIDSMNSVDPLQNLFKVKTLGDTPQSCPECELRGAVLNAAQLCGLAQRMIDLSVEYAKERQQFGKAIGSFQAIKHQLATVYTQVEFTRPMIHLAALQGGHAVHQAQIAAIDTAMMAGEIAIQIHGAMGYTFEAALHLFMKKAWWLCGEWGDRNYHMKQLEQNVFADDTILGPSTSFRI